MDVCKPSWHLCLTMKLGMKLKCLTVAPGLLLAWRGCLSLAEWYIKGSACSLLSLNVVGEKDRLLNIL